MTTNIKVGYIRVSSKDQNEARQIEQLKKIGIEDRYIFIDKESGKDFNRENYKAMMKVIREGDVVFVTSLDRLGRNYRETGEQWDIITNEVKADMVVLDMPLLDTREKKDLTGTLISDIVIKLLLYVDEKEREHIRQRQAEGIKLGKERGVYKGRKPIEIDKNKFEEVYAEVIRKDRTNKSAMKKLGLKTNTYYKAVNEYKTKTGRWG